MGPLYFPIHYSKALSLCFPRVARSLVALICLVALPRVLAGQADTARADTTTFGVRPTSSVPSLPLREPPALRAPWLGAPRIPPALRALAWDSTVAGVLDSARAERATALRLPHPVRTAPRSRKKRTRENRRPGVRERRTGALPEVCRPGPRRPSQTRAPNRPAPQRALQPGPAARSQLRLPRRLQATEAGQPGEPQVRRHHRPAGPHQRRLRHRARLHRQ